MAADFQNLLIEALPSMKAFAMTLCRNRTRAEDLVQDAACRALAKMELSEPGTNFKARVFTIMRNHYIDTIRQQKRETQVELDDDEMAKVRFQSPNQEHALVLKEVQSAINTLIPEQREVLQLVVVNGLSYDDAAAVCGCPVGTIRSRLARARREIERQITGEKPRTPVAGRVQPRAQNREMMQ
jgi:RNA polymerase sigma-70 factor (ECF subfamily)